MLGASPHKLINEVEVNHNEKLKNKNMRVIEGAYQKAPYYNEVKDLLEKIMNGEQKSISDFILNSFKIINEYLEIDTELILSSTLNKDCSLKGQDKVLSICELLGATEYYNAIGGQELYSFEEFKKHGIEFEIFGNW